jgi:hypothetical protein
MLGLNMGLLTLLFYEIVRQTDELIKQVYLLPTTLTTIMSSKLDHADQIKMVARFVD